MTVVAIDGPAGSGKSTLARRLAVELGLPYLNTGQMYRAVALLARARGIDPDDGDALAELARDTTFGLDLTLEPPRLTIDGRAPDAELASPEVESTVSRVARHPQVRAVLRETQRRLIEGGAVVEGRDIGSVVAPDADVKLYLSARESARISRRSAERGPDSQDVGDALTSRDAADARTNPFVPAADAVEIDTTALDRDEVHRRALEVVRSRVRLR
jgi:CMP/dCMP kinase